jgi:hypothetical protein
MSEIEGTEIMLVSDGLDGLQEHKMHRTIETLPGLVRDSTRLGPFAYAILETLLPTTSHFRRITLFSAKSADERELRSSARVVLA